MKKKDKRCYVIFFISVQFSTVIGLIFSLRAKFQTFLCLIKPVDCEVPKLSEIPDINSIIAEKRFPLIPEVNINL